MKHYNYEIIKRVSDFFKAKNEEMPTEVNDQLILNYDIQPEIDNASFQTNTNATQATILTTSSTRDLYLVGATLNVSKDAVNTGTFSSISAVVKGTTITIARIGYLALTASNNENMVIMFPKPIKIDRGTPIYLNNETNVAVIRSVATIYYYYLD